MYRTVLKSKIHRATVTRADLDYEGSCTIDAELMRLADIRAGEQVHIVNVSNGSRAITYAIEGEPGELGLNGAIAHTGRSGDIVIVMSYAHLDEAEMEGFAPLIIRLDGHNRPLTIGDTEESPRYEKVIVH